MSMIHIESLIFHYPSGEFQLEIPEFTVARGEKMAVIGPSGSGKTTLLNLIAGIMTPVEGRVRVKNIQVSELGDAERRNFRITTIGFVFQDFELLDYLNVFDNILHPFRITSALKMDRVVKERATALAKEMGIGDKLKRMARPVAGRKATVMAIILVFALSIRLRQREMETVFKLGCSRMTMARLVASEILMIVFTSGIFCSAMVMVVHQFSNDLVRTLFIR